MDPQLKFLKTVEALGGSTKFIPLEKIQKAYPNCPEYQDVKLMVNPAYISDSGFGTRSEFMITPAGREYIMTQENEKRSLVIALVTLAASVVAAVAALLQFFL